MRRMALSRSSKTFNVERGFGSRNLYLAANSTRFASSTTNPFSFRCRCLIVSVMFWEKNGGGIEPLSTTLRHVSGIKRMSGMKTTAEKINRNQNIQCQPAYCPITPPRIGDRIGPSIPPREANAIYVPLSDDVIISPTTPLARATVLEEPAA